MSKLNQSINVVMFDDSTSSNNPLLKVVDWTQKYTGIPVQNPVSEHVTLDPGEVRQIFTGQRSLAVDGTTTFSLALSVLDPSIYRLTATSGTAPGFRTNRNLALNGETVTVTVDNNAIATIDLNSLSVPTFAGVQVGDTMYVPGTSTGDSASPMGPLNEGYWTVIAVATRRLSLKRMPGEKFSGASGAFTLTSNAQVQVFSSGPVRVGDTLSLSAGFSSVTLNTYVITAVTAGMIEFSSTDPIPLETGILPGATGIAIYSRAKCYLRVEADQLVAVRVNGDTSDRNTIKPRKVADPAGVAWYDAWGPVFDLVLVNKNTTDPCNAIVISAEESE